MQGSSGGGGSLGRPCFPAMLAVPPTVMSGPPFRPNHAHARSPTGQARHFALMHIGEAFGKAADLSRQWSKQCVGALVETMERDEDTGVRQTAALVLAAVAAQVRRDSAEPRLALGAGSGWAG